MIVVARGVSGWLALAEQVTIPGSPAIQLLRVYASSAYDAYTHPSDTQGVFEACRNQVFAHLREPTMSELELVSELNEALLRRSQLVEQGTL